MKTTTSSVTQSPMFSTAFGGGGWGKVAPELFDTTLTDELLKNVSVDETGDYIEALWRSVDDLPNAT